MILFQEDWAKYPRAIADFDTKNRSFVKLAALYKAMGVHNHTFMLALHDSTLKGIDPFSPILSGETIRRITIECKLNPWYFFREIARVPGGSGDDAVMLEANRGNIGLFWYFFNHVTTYLIQIRQTGKSLNSDILDCYLLNIRCTDTTINLLTKDRDLRAANIQRIKDIFGELPWYLNQRTKKDVDNTEVIHISSLKNWYRTAVPQSSPVAALKVGRGFTAAITKNDEGPFQNNAQISIPAMLAAGTNARDRARKNNEPYGTVFTTTAGKKDEVAGKFFYQEVSCAAVHNEHFYDCRNVDDLETKVRNASRTNLRTFKKTGTGRGEYAVNITLNHRQLGKTDAWLMRAIEESKASGDDANRDFFNLWTSGGIRSPHDPSDADRMRASETEPVWIDTTSKQGYTIRWYIPRDKIDFVMNNNKIIVTADTSDASGGDDIGISGYLDKTGQTIFSCNINVTNLSVFSDWFAQDIVIKYPNTISIIERKSSGIALIDHLLNVLPALGIDPFKRLFNRVVNEREEHPREWEEIQGPMSRRDRDIYVRTKRHFGFATSSGGVTSRSDLYSITMSSAVRLVGSVIYDKTTIDQILGLIIKSGRVDHAPGEHDDLVISWLLGHWMMTQARNLFFYGIVVTDLFSLSKRSNKMTDREEYAANQQKFIKSSIQKLLEELSAESDQHIVDRKEQHIRLLKTQLTHDDAEMFSVDELIAKTQDMRKRRFEQRNQYQNYNVNRYAQLNSLDTSDKYSSSRSSFYI